MARRRIGQAMLVFSAEGAGRQSSLDKLLDLIDWTSAEHHLRDISCAAKGAGLAALGLVKGHADRGLA